jgi:hypothetical protein
MKHLILLPIIALAACSTQEEPVQIAPESVQVVEEVAPIIVTTKAGKLVVVEEPEATPEPIVVEVVEPTPEPVEVEVEVVEEPVEVEVVEEPAPVVEEEVEIVVDNTYQM